MRKLCKKCQINPVAINYRKNNRIYYRSVCDRCTRNSDGVPKWYLSGYRLKMKCDRCGFASQHKKQFNVFHIDGNLNNCRQTNLRSVCANCQRILQELGLPWRQGDLTPDFPPR